MSNSVTKEELDYFFSIHYFRLNKKFQIWSGLWPYDSSWRKTIIRVLFYSVIGLAFIPLIGGVKLWCGVNMAYCGENIAGTIYTIIVLLKFFVTSLSEESLGNLYGQVVKNWMKIDNPDEHAILVDYAKVGKLYSVVYTVYISLAGVAFSQVPAIPVVLDIFFPRNESRQHIMFVNGDFIVDPIEHFPKLYVYFLAATILSLTAFIGIDTTYAAIIHQILGVISIIKHRLFTATESVNLKEDTSYEIVIQVICLHSDAISYVKMIEAAYNLCFLVVMMVSVCFLSVGAVTIMMSTGNILILVKFFLIEVAIIIHILYLSVLAQKIIDHSEDLYNSIYAIKWYNTSQKTKKLLQFMMLRSTKPLFITAGGLYIMSIQNFGLLMKSAVSYMTVAASFK